ncbi:MAG: NlpC/P60 family protein [Salibacteraceae bacterium]
MKYGICPLSVVPGRLEPNDRSELVTQVLFGDHYKIVDERAKWSRIRLASDKYECWIDRKQVHEITKDFYQSLEKSSSHQVSLDLVGVVTPADGSSPLPILMGSSLPAYQEGALRLGDKAYHFDGFSIDTRQKPDKSKVVEHAFMYLKAPYLWGGRGPFVIDSSGISQVVYKLIGKKLPRDAYQQAEIGTTLSFVEEAEPGDLAFFDNDEGIIIHVGILLENNHIIHASGEVRVDRIDHQGIFNVDTKKYSHKLRLIKRIL